MLILHRRPGERILITAPDGTILEVAVFAFKNGGLRIGVKAPLDWAVHREEVYYRIHPEKREERANAPKSSAD